jgi:hypothetical protein
MLHDSQLPKFLWGEATKHAVYLKNRMWTCTLGDTTPFEILIKKKPDLANHGDAMFEYTIPVEVNLMEGQRCWIM